MQIMSALQIYAAVTFQLVVGDLFGVNLKILEGGEGDVFPVTVKYRQPYAIPVVTNSIMCTVTVMW